MDLKRHLNAKSILLTLFLSILVCQGCIQSSKDECLNVIFIVIDTLRPDHLGCYGYTRDTSPHIDSLAKQGVLFKNTIAQAPWTKPSVASFFTSTLPSTHGVTWRGRNSTLPTSMLTLAEILKQNGYKTAAFSDNPHINSFNGFDQGFDTFIENNHFLRGNAEPLTNKMIGWLKQHSGEKHFTYIHYLDPHDPYQAPGTYCDMFINKKEMNVRKAVKTGNAYFLNGESVLDKRMKSNGKSLLPQDYPLPTPITISEKELNYLISLYDGEIRYVDYHLGRLMAALRDLKTFDKTAIVITSDHGEEFLEHGIFRHGYHLYDEIIKVPLIIVLPHSDKTPLEIKTPVNLIDLMPTILNLLAIPLPSGMQGKSLISLINKGKRAVSPSVSETSWKGARAQSLRLTGWKYINDIRNERFELFNLDEDPGEKNNLHLKKPKRVEELSHLLSNIISKTYPVTGKPKRKNIQPKKEERDKLKSLGYIQ